MSDEQNQMTETLPKKSTNFTAIWIILILIILGFFGIFGYIKWMQINQQLHDLKERVQSSVTVQQEQLKPIDETIKQIQTTQTSLKTMIDQQGEVLSTWKNVASGNIDKWYVAEARYLVNLAQLEANSSGHYLLINGYLEKAQAILQQVNDPKAVEMRTAIKQDQTQVLNQASSNDIANLFQQLMTLDKEIDNLPFPLQKLQAPVEKNNVAPSNQTWWKKGLMESWQVLKEVVVVKKNINNEKPFLLPDEKTFLQANLHLKIQHAMDGLLRNQETIYAGSLQQAIDWVNQYYNKDDERTVAWLKQINSLKQIDLSNTKLDVSHALPLLDAYLK